MQGSKRYSGFDPRTVGGCGLWLDAADPAVFTLSGSNVTEWRDKSGNLRHATAFNSPVYSSTTGSVTLNGTNQYFTCPNASYRPITIFAVVTYIGTAGSTILRKGYATGTSFEFSIDIQSATTLRYYLITSTSGVVAVTPTVTTTRGRQLYGLTYDNATAVAYQNGVSVGTASGVGPMFTGSSLLFLGVTPDNANNPLVEYFTGSLHELILFTTAPTTSQRQQVEGYLARKWGLLGTLQGPSLTVAPVPPISVPGCQMWLDAAGTSTLTLNGSNVSQWRDKTSNAYAISQATPSNQPAFLTNQLNGFGGVQQGPTTHLFVAGTSISNFAYGQETSVFFVVRNASANTSWNIFATMFFTAGGGQSTKSRWHLSFNQGGTQGLTLIVGNTPQTAIQNTSFVTPPSTPAIVGFTLSQSSILLDLNGTVSTHAGYTIGNADDGIGLALADPRANIASNSMVFEMVGFNRVISTSERQQVEGYLAQKWGLLSVLPATHPFQSPFASTHPYKMTPLL